MSPPTPQEMAFGRLAVQSGLLPSEQVRRVAGARAAGRPLWEELVAQGLLSRAQEQWLHAELVRRTAARGSGPGAPLPTPSSEAPTHHDGSAPGSGSSGRVRLVEAPPPLPEPGTTIDGRYRLESLLGRGGMGAVFRARDLQQGEEVALKLMLRRGGSEAATRALERFRREAEAAARVDAHPHVVRMRAAGVHEEMPYAVQELVVGEDLGSVVKARGPLPLDWALEKVEAVARAVQHCHERGILHRDLKPANVLLRAADQAPLVTDFGLALDVEERERLTQTGVALGTPAYMPPEQAEGNKHAMDARADVYSLGAVLYELLVGRPPFEGRSMVEVMAQLFRVPPEPVHRQRPELPRDVDSICQKALAKERAHRYRSAAEFADDLARLRRGEPIRARRPRWHELFRWRLRRRDPRAWGALLVPVLLLCGLGSLGLGHYLSGASRRAAETRWRTLRDGLLPRALGGDPLLRQESPREGQAAAATELAGALQELERELGGAGASLAGSPSEVLRQARARTEAPTRADAFGRRLGDLLGERPGAADDLGRLARRVALTRGKGWPEPVSDPPGAAPEDLLLDALQLLRWREDPEAGGPPPRAPEARARLTRAAESGGRQVRQAARDVLQALDALDRELERALRGPRLLAGEGWELGPAVARRIEPGLSWTYRDALRREKPAAVLELLDGLHDDLERWPPARWRERRSYEALLGALESLRRFVSEERPEHGPLLLRLEEGATQPAPAFAGQLRQRMLEVFALASARAQRHRPPRAGFAAYLRFAFVALVFLDWSDPAARERLREVTLIPVASAMQGALEAGQPPGLLLITLVLRLEVMPAMRLLQPRQRLDSGELRRFLAEHPWGDAYLLRAEMLDHVEQIVEQQPETVLSLANAYATSLGERLPPARRKRLGLLPVLPLERPLTPGWRAYALGRCARFVLRWQRHLPAGERSRATREAGLELLRQLGPREADFRIKTYWLRVLQTLAEELAHYARDHVLDEDPTRAAELAEEQLASYELGIPHAWRLLKQARERPAQSEQQLILLTRDDDPVQVGDQLWELVIGKCTTLRALGRRAEAIACVEDYAARSRDPRAVGPPFATVLAALWRCEEGQHQGAGEAARAYLEAWGDANAEHFGVCHGLLAWLGLEAGRLDEALAARQALAGSPRAAGDPLWRTAAAWLHLREGRRAQAQTTLARVEALPFLSAGCLLPEPWLEPVRAELAANAGD